MSTRNQLDLNCITDLVATTITYLKSKFETTKKGVKNTQH